MRTTPVLTLLLAGCLVASGQARAQDPPPYPGGSDASQDQQAPPPPQGDDAAPTQDPGAASVDYFHQQLSPYGQWVQRDGYGMVWVPNVNPGWRPYTTGHWIYTDQGWAWVADESWGWAPFHYGRWYYDAEIGWGWVPGTVWAPAWVGWRSGGGYVGWAPLAPSIGFTYGVGIDFGRVVISPGFYTFCGERDILAPRVATVIVPSARNVTIVQNATNITNITVVNNRVVNQGVAVAHIEQVTGRSIPRVQVATMASASGRRGAFYQPAVVTRAATVSHAEFGKSLASQVAVQRRSRAFTQVTSSTPKGGSTAAKSGRPANTNEATGHFGVGNSAPHGNTTGTGQQHPTGPSGPSGPQQGQKATAQGQKAAGEKHPTPPPPKPKPKEHEDEHKPPPV